MSTAQTLRVSAGRVLHERGPRSKLGQCALPQLPRRVAVHLDGLRGLRPGHEERRRPKDNVFTHSSALPGLQSPGCKTKGISSDNTDFGQASIAYDAVDAGSQAVRPEPADPAEEGLLVVI